MVSIKSRLIRVLRKRLIRYIIFALIIFSYLLALSKSGYLKIPPNVTYVVNTPACRIPFMKPFDEQVLPYFSKHFEKNCQTGILTNLVTSNSTHLTFNDQSYVDLNLKIGDVKCYYQHFFRDDSDNRTTLEVYKYQYRMWINRLSNVSVRIKDEFLRVKCLHHYQNILTDFHAFVPKKKHKNRPKHESKKSKNKFNVILFGIEGMSRINFHRTMPRTIDYLENYLDPIEFFGYTKVGDKSFANLLPVLTGSSEKDRQSCLGLESHFDTCDFIWKYFNKTGYATVFAENAPYLGPFHYLRKGFYKQPTTYFWNTFAARADAEIGFNKYKMINYCYGNKYSYNHLLEYITKVAGTYKRRNENYFGFLWENTLTLERLCQPALADFDFRDFFKTLNNLGVFKNTVLIFFSDGGKRWGKPSNKQSYLEERLPMLYIILPKIFKSKHPSETKSMIINTRRLTTPFDIHETLKSILYQNLSTPLSFVPRGISLFTTIPEFRTCELANIAAHWCTCYEIRTININHPHVIKAALVAISHINQKLINYGECADLELSQVLRASLSVKRDVLDRVVNDYSVNFVTFPGSGQFEATVRCLNCDDVNSYEITGTITRTNNYDRDSFCMLKIELVIYCYCIFQNEHNN